MIPSILKFIELDFSVSKCALWFFNVKVLKCHELLREIESIRFFFAQSTPIITKRFLLGSCPKDFITCFIFKHAPSPFTIQMHIFSLASASISIVWLFGVLSLSLSIFRCFFCCCVRAFVIWLNGLSKLLSRDVENLHPKKLYKFNKR